MWLEGVLATLAVVVVMGVASTSYIVFPEEIKRIGQIIRAEIESRLPKRRPSIDIALHADLDVDMTWWDEEFAKLQGIERSTLADSWGDYVEHLHSSISDAKTPTMAELAGVNSVKEGDYTYSVSNLLDIHKDQVLAAIAPGVDIVPIEPWIRILQSIDAADTIDVLQSRSKSALEEIRYHRDIADKCEFCEYIEERTYMNRYPILRRVYLCWDCEQKKKRMSQHLTARRINEDIANRA